MTAGWIMSGVFCGILAGAWFYEADIFWFEEGFTFGFLCIVALWGLWNSRIGSLHPLYWRGNHGIGLTRVAVWLSMLWCVFVLAFFGDETIRGIWTVFYLLMGYGAVKLFGQMAPARFGLRLRVDVYERRNMAAAWVIAGFTLATGMIAGGAMWGSVDDMALEYGWIFQFLPSYEDGWWITPWFFGMGWVILYITMWVWFRRERGESGEAFGASVRRVRNEADGRAAAVFCVACALPLTDAVAGDYHGFRDSLLGFAFVALPVLAHEVLRPRVASDGRNAVELWIYLALGTAAVILTPFLSAALGFRP